jgi:hypothetical protein
VRVRSEVFLVLWIYIAATACILSYAHTNTPDRLMAGVLAGLITMAFMLILDIDRPASGGITEGQQPRQTDQAAAGNIRSLARALK